MSAEQLITKEADTTPLAWQRVISMTRYMPRIALGFLVFSSSACNLASGPDLVQNTLLGSVVFGHTSDLVFWGDIRDRNTRVLMGIGSVALGSVISLAVAEKFGMTAGGLLTFGEGVISLGLTTLWAVSTVQDKAREIIGQ